MGAAAVFGPQKGADAATVALLVLLGLTVAGTVVYTIEAERIEARRKAWDDGAWVREAATAAARTARGVRQAAHEGGAGS